jgi:hypothetical protein
MIEGARKAAAAPLEIGKHAIPPLGAQRTEALLEESFVILCALGLGCGSGCGASVKRISSENCAARSNRSHNFFLLCAGDGSPLEPLQPTRERLLLICCR